MSHNAVDPALERERRRRTRAIMQACQVLLLFLALSIKAGWLGAVLTVTIVGLACLGVLYGYLGNYRRRYGLRRGRVSPSWPAMVSNARGPGYTRRSDVRGRLTVTADGFQWRPSAGERKHHPVAALRWSRDSYVQLERIWGLGQPGRLRLLNGHADPVDLWVYNAKSLQRVLKARK